MSCDMDSCIVIKAVGDICPGDKSVPGIGIFSKTMKYGANYPFERIRNELSGSDICLANLEGLLSRRMVAGGKDILTFCGLPEFAEAMVYSGINVVNVANNHMLEHGENVFRETVQILRDAGLKVCGLRSRSEKYYSDPVIMSLKGKVVGILGYNWVGIDKFAGSDQIIAQSRDSIVNYTWDRRKQRNTPNEISNSNVIHDIKILRSQVDILILMAHWAYEFVTIPPNGVIKEAHSFVEAGADMIIGSHPHVLQGNEKYKNGIIVYSLGNFIFDLPYPLTKKTCILDIKVGSRDEITYGYIPCRINRSYQPESLSGEEAVELQDLIKKSSQMISCLFGKEELDDDRLYKEYERGYRLLKLYTIIAHLLAVRENPEISKVIMQKVLRLAKLILSRMKGQRVRW